MNALRVWQHKSFQGTDAKIASCKKKEIGAKIANFASGSMHAFQHQQSPSIFSYNKKIVLQLEKKSWTLIFCNPFLERIEHRAER